MLLRSLQLRRVLSFGPESPPVEFSPLNLIIGPNGSGKSNLIDAISLLQAAPRDLTTVVREGGGPQAWIWRGDRDGKGELEATISLPSAWNLRHRLAFTEDNHRFSIVEEHIDEECSDPAQVMNSVTRRKERTTIYADGNPRAGRIELLDPQRSVLGQRRDPEQYSGLAFLSDAYDEIRVYRGWTFGRHAPPRWPQPADLPTDHLLEDASNLALVLNSFRIEGDAHNGVLAALRQLYDGIVDFHVQIVGGTVQLFLDEGGGRKIPASRLSDGTLRWLSLLAVLLDPRPPRLVCIEEPELGLHPDMIPELARLLRSAAERMQLIVTTHSVGLVDAFTSTPESVQVCERHEATTTIRRLDVGDLAEWLEHYSLGELWTKGQIGGLGGEQEGLGVRRGWRRLSARTDAAASRVRSVDQAVAR